MNDAITDTNDVPLSYLSLQQAESADSAVFVIRVPARASTFLAAEDNPYLRVFARKTGTADAFVDLKLTPISLAPYAGVDGFGILFTADFDVKVHTNAVSNNRSEGVNVKVTFNP